MLCEQIVAASHEINEDMQEVNTIEYNGIIVYILLERTSEISRMLCPVHSGMDMVANVITIIPALHIVFGIDAGYTVFICICWVACINEGVLGPVSCHGNNTEGDKWQNEYYKRCRPVNKT